ncbi:MAG: aldose reductase [Benjaminiella poitrasii]|nr:MAG: aldose reductase [Benjaminiella poitrasii]
MLIYILCIGRFHRNSMDTNFLNEIQSGLKDARVPIIDTWRAMEKLVKDGKACSIGVPNFTIPMHGDLLSKCENPPAVNQVHPGLPQEETLAYCKSENIILAAYSPLVNPVFLDAFKPIEEPIIFELTKKYSKTSVQLLLNWGINRGYAVIPKSVTPPSN